MEPEAVVALLGEPAIHLLGLVGGAVVEDEMELYPGVTALGVASLEQLQEVEELPRPMALGVLGGDLLAGNFERGAASVLGNVRAMQEALRIGSASDRVTPETILRIHARLFKGTRDERIAGRYRTSQNWIGHGDNPHRATFIPVPETEVPRLVQDLCAFIGRDDVSPLIQAAIAHAQFETIHPFEDGNGRTGRALIHLVLRRRGLAPHYVPPISVVLATNHEAYIAGLTAYRQRHDDEWCGTFARAAAIAAEGARTLAVEIERLKARWAAQAASPRAGSAAAKLIERLPSHPVFDLKSATDFLEVSDEAARLGIDRLARTGVVTEITKRRWGRAWESVGLFALLDGFDRQLAKPTGPGRARAAPRATARAGSA